MFEQRLLGDLQQGKSKRHNNTMNSAKESLSLKQLYYPYDNVIGSIYVSLTNVRYMLALVMWCQWIRYPTIYAIAGST